MVVGAVLICSNTFAGNEDRVGSAGASQLMVNPWARSLGSADAGVANTNGLEATYTNIAGLAFVDKTQIKFNYTNWMGSANVPYMSAGIAQRVSETGVFSLSIQSMNFGSTPVTTVELPEGGGAMFTPTFSVFNLGYAKKFSNSISGGINLKVISESIANLKANGIAIDAGVRYMGEGEKFKFGITLKNIGPTMRYKGDGLATQINYNATGVLATLEQRSQSYEMPSLLNIGTSYDFIFDENSKLTAMAAFTANSFSSDQYRIGLDYGISTEKAAFNIRAGYVAEKDIFNSEKRNNALTGFTAGFSVDAFAGANKSPLGIEYAIRLSNPFGVIHTIGATISIK